MEPTLRCPSCGNPLAVVDAPTVQCPFCKMTVPVPAMFRRPVQVVVGPQNPYGPSLQTPYVAPPIRIVHGPTRSNPAAPIIVVAAVLAMMGAGAAMFLVRAAPRPSQTSGPQTATAATVDEPKAGTPLLVFGGKGTGAGRFDDARALAIGPDDEIWVADYEGGRVQQFDAKGKFVRAIQVPPESPDGNIYVSTLAADHAGHLFVGRNGQILRFSTATGALEKTFSVGAWSIAVDPQNTIWTAGDHDEILHLDGEGKTLHRWTDVIKSANKKDPAMSPEIAVDGVGHVFLGSLMSGIAYVFDNEMHFQNRFAMKGDNGEPESDLVAIAVHPRGHVYVGHLWKISEYDLDGTFVRDVPGADAMRSIAFDSKGHLLFVRTNDQKVVELDVSSE